MTTDTAIQARDIAGELWDAAIRCDFDAFKIEVANALAPTPSAQEEAVRVPEGYALVPLKPTAEIVQAGGEARISDFNRNGTTLSVRDANRVAEAMYRAMIAAAPAASAGDQEVGS
jgi:hypothetical protein